MRAGVLALQGAVEPHVELLRGLGADPVLVRSRDSLEGVTHLVLPGGESTTLHRLLVLFELWDEIPRRVRSGDLAVLGTCAGAILLGREADERPPRWGLVDGEVRRNGYGRQLDSESRRVQWSAAPGEVPSPEFSAPFIRAPRFGDLGDTVEILAHVDGEPVAVRDGSGWAATFHPELVGETRLHRAFLREVGPGKSAQRPPVSAPASELGSGSTPGSPAVDGGPMELDPWNSPAPS